MALIGNTADAFGQTWHLPIDQTLPSYSEMIGIAATVLNRRISYTVLPNAVFRLGGRFISALAEVGELLPRYRGDNIFDTEKFTARFPTSRSPRRSRGSGRS